MTAAIIGIMGPGNASAETLQEAHWLGGMVARHGWVTLSGGRNAGTMAATNRGAREAGGLTLGILPDADTRLASPDVLLPICTGMGSARNNINVLSAHVVVVICRDAGAGTLSEIALALKAAKDTILYRASPQLRHVLEDLQSPNLFTADSRDELEHLLLSRLRASGIRFRQLAPLA